MHKTTLLFALIAVPACYENFEVEYEERYGIAVAEWAGSDTGNDDQPAAEGQPCTIDADCLSGNCYMTAFFNGKCSECSDGSDCDFGCSAPTVWGTDGAVCGLGARGDGCDSDFDCAGLRCATVVDLLGLIERRTCGECIIDADCPPGEACVPHVNPATLRGYMACSVSNSLSDGRLCNLGSAEECQGHCGSSEWAGIFEVGICGECETDADCGQGSCVAGSVYNGVVTAPLCI